MGGDLRGRLDGGYSYSKTACVHSRVDCQSIDSRVARCRPAPTCIALHPALEQQARLYFSPARAPRTPSFSWLSYVFNPCTLAPSRLSNVCVPSRDIHPSHPSSAVCLLVCLPCLLWNTHLYSSGFWLCVLSGHSFNRTRHIRLAFLFLSLFPSPIIPACAPPSGPPGDRKNAHDHGDRRGATRGGLPLPPGPRQSRTGWRRLTFFVCSGAGGEGHGRLIRNRGRQQQQPDCQQGEQTWQGPYPASRRSRP